MKVVDASALAAILFDEPEADEIAARLHGEHLVAPPLLRYEVTNVCRTKCRRHPADRDDVIRRLRRGLRFAIEEKRVDFEAVLVLALETNLSVYDACYLNLALELDAELVTLDKALENAWASRTRPA